MSMWGVAVTHVCVESDIASNVMSSVHQVQPPKTKKLPRGAPMSISLAAENIIEDPHGVINSEKIQESWSHPENVSRTDTKESSADTKMECKDGENFKQHGLSSGSCDMCRLMCNGALQKTPGQRPLETEEAQKETAMRGSTVPFLLRMVACVDCVFHRVDALATVIERAQQVTCRSTVR